jgi:hypothetical protein
MSLSPLLSSSLPFSTYPILLLFSTYTPPLTPIYLPYFTPSFFHVPLFLLLAGAVRLLAWPSVRYWTFTMART